MKRVVFASLFLPLFQACFVDNHVAEDPGSQSAESRVAAAAPDWCETTCNRLVECPQAPCECVDDVCECTSTTDAAECTADCREYFEDTFLGHGETCAS